MELRLFFLPNFPRATFIQGATFIPESRVAPKLCFVVQATENIKYSVIHADESHVVKTCMNLQL